MGSRVPSAGLRPASDAQAMSSAALTARARTRPRTGIGAATNAATAAHSSPTYSRDPPDVVCAMPSGSRRTSSGSTMR